MGDGVTEPLSHSLIDVWQRAAAYFIGQSEEAPEVIIQNLPPEAMRALLTHLMNRAREVTTQFTLRDTNIQVISPSPHMAAMALSRGHINGGMWLTLPPLPVLGFFVDQPESLSISFVRGSWDAMSLTALFVLLRDIYFFAPHAIIRLDEFSYTIDERRAFDHVWQAYRHETA